MKIISPYKDYYDSAMAYGTDDSVVYRRYSETTVYASNVWPYKHDVLQHLTQIPCHNDYYFPWVRPVVLAVAGRVYPLWTTGREDINYPGVAYRHILDKDELARIARDEVDKRGSYTPDANRFLTGTSVRGFTNASVERYCTDYAGTLIDYEVFQALGAPSFLLTYFVEDHVGHYTLTTNPELSKCKFFKYKDAYATYQELGMFVGGVLGTVDTAPTRVGGDAIAITSHGFDEHSFRTQAPGNKKANRELNRLRKRGLL